ncbi:ATP-binding cassette sub-family C member 4-like isoform X1 [Schistocerca americana]|uniref:ATP-binding cassette sub-family C member 4-like isoform X1 n=1 Tax=Schistocerca americana TaxID=7009 RepID=UPI001F4FB9A0|nr:ATP-binding cassette sub-family C member 4-like isoform X1 [Schistocerca americana]
MNAAKPFPGPSPKASAGHVSKLFFWWMRNLAWKSYKESLTEEDLREPLETDKSKRLGDELERNWLSEVEKATAKGRKPSLLLAIMKTFWLQYLGCGIVLLIEELVFRVAQPIMLGQIVEHFTQGSSMTSGEACAYAAALCIIVFVKNCFYHHYMMLAQLVGMRIRVACCSLLYRKVLRLNRQELDQAATGQILNLMTNDVSRFDQALQFGHWIWLSVLQVIVITFCLYQYLQEAAIIGFVCIFILTMPLQGFLGRVSAGLRKKIAVLTDDRMRHMNEIVNGVRVIKMYAWERAFAKIVAITRKKEISKIVQSAYLRAFIISSIVFIERISTFVTLFSYWMFGNVIKPNKVFVLAQYYNILTLTLTYFFPMGIYSCGECQVSIKRVQEFLDKREELSVDEEGVGKGEIRMDRATACWSAPQETLNDLSLHVLPGSLCAVIGPVGSGKSSLLYSILGELRLKNGSVARRGTVAYVNQEPWVFTGTVKQNILFGQPFDSHKYKEIVRVCFLERDFQLLPKGDETIVGGRGINLSGGQRARINLARAVYSNADIYLLDDPLSAVDTHVGKHLFNECICGYLEQKTRILVTHQLQYLQKADHIVILNNGGVETQGSFGDIVSSGLNFAKLLSDKDDPDEENDGDQMLGKVEEKLIRRSVRIGSKRNTDVHVPNRGDTSELAEVSVLLEESGKVLDDDQEEKIGEGFTWSTYWHYFKAGGNVCTLAVIPFFFLIAQITTSGSDYWLTYWSNTEAERYSTSGYHVATNDTDQYKIELWDQEPTSETFVEGYGILVAGCVVLTLLRSAAFFKLCMRASRNLHNRAFEALLLSKMRFFDTNPSGRILNRFSKDVGAMDELLPQAMLFMTQIYLTLCGIMVMVIIVNYYLIIAIVICAVFFYYISIVLISTAREAKKLEAMKRSPVFSHLSDSLNGLSTIHASGTQGKICDEFDTHQDHHTAGWFLFITTGITLGFWLDFLNAIFITVVTFSFLILESAVTFLGGNVGLAITQSLVLTGMLQHGILQMSETVSQMTSVERILEYTRIEPETSLETNDADNVPEETWPSKGMVTFRNVNLKYTVNDPPVLKNLNFTIEAGCKVGIVGQTGAGKSSILTALFRLAPVEGIILIDGIDTAKISLHNLRRKVSIIPQEPVLFCGTMRYNLDPFDEFEDAQLWSVLEEVELKSSVQSLEDPVTEGGSNFSVGQRQLICLARAILRNNKIIVLDEATANVDLETDALIQKTMRRKFDSCTVLIIAHRLHTVIDADRILVMDAGRLMEFDHPHILLQNKSGFLHKLVQETGKNMAEQLQTAAEQAFSKKSSVNLSSITY